MKMRCECFLSKVCEILSDFHTRKTLRGNQKRNVFRLQAGVNLHGIPILGKSKRDH